MSASEIPVKLVVWDLDNTIWNGVLLENDDIVLRQDALMVIKELDKRGIVQSIASKNDQELALKKLSEFGIKHYFLCPEIHWGNKSESVHRIAKNINININSVAFIDDQLFERAEVIHSLPEVECLDHINLLEHLSNPRLNPSFITEDTRNRRLMYVQEFQRKALEEKSGLPKNEFLETLNLRMTISQAKQNDLKRLEELTIRTNQFNTSGTLYNYDELNSLMLAENYKLLVVSLEDKFGSYGKVGLVLLEIMNGDTWRIKLLLMSCRVISRGVGSVLIACILQEAQKEGIKIEADFKENSSNRQMLITYRFLGFEVKDRNHSDYVLTHRLINIPEVPSYIDLTVENF